MIYSTQPKNPINPGCEDILAGAKTLSTSFFRRLVRLIARL